MTVHLRAVSLDDKFVAETGTIYATGIQTLVRISLDQIRRDRAAGLKTAGFWSGYRGSPLGGVDQELVRNRRHIAAHDIVFTPGVNEELGATAVWGTQKVGLHGKGSEYEGVFGIWYGKAPGVDRASDVLKQGNASGTAANGGVLALAGDDPLAKSSILPAQSDFCFLNFEMPFFNPADLQDVLDYGLHAIALSRYAGLWSGMICLADTMDASGLVRVDPDRLTFAMPAEFDPRKDADVNRVLLLGNRLETERILRDVRLPAVGAYQRANRLDRVAFGARRGRYGIVATGKAYRDLRQALELLGIDAKRARAMGLTVYKVAMPWPLEPSGIAEFATGLERMLVVEHKRPFLEPQIKEQLYAWPTEARPRIWGKRTPEGAPFLSDLLELRTQDIVEALMGFVPEIAEDEAARKVAERMVMQSAWAAGHAEGAQRTAYFCAGCPHSTSTKVPDGSRALPGIGCHAMTEINERTTDGQIAMGGEGATWVGQAPFARDRHVFVNLGDGTYYHSGLLAIRQAVSAKVPITYKILFNDAVAMTGGQPVDGPLTVPNLTRQLHAEGVGRIVVLTERPHLYDGRKDLAPSVPVVHRDELGPVEEELAAFPGVSAIVYDQTCAAEKRRRRKKGDYEDPDLRLFINKRVCEGCGDCSVQSNCIAVEPAATDFGEKRVINQSSCNKDFSCVKGFCPSFAWVEGAALKRADAGGFDADALAAKIPLPDPMTLDGTRNVLITGIGGYGVTTIAAVLAMAGHVDGINASTLDMTGLAQKNGPVTSHLRFAPAGQDIEGPRVPPAALDTLIASDMLVACNADSLAMLSADRTLAIVNTKVQPTAEFVMKRTLSFDEARMQKTLKEGARETIAVDVAFAAEKLFGDTIFMNMMLVGAAYQKGGLPLTEDGIVTAIRLNGAAIDKNIAAFKAGRVLAANPDAILDLLPEKPAVKTMTLDERVEFLCGELTAYQNAKLARRFRDLVERVKRADAANGQKGLRLTRLVADNLFKVMAYKDEYEVARLYADPAYQADLRATFADPKKLKIMLAPPMLSRTDPATGRPKKRAFGPWVFRVFGVLERLKGLRGTLLDPFGHTAERKAERAEIRLYEESVEQILAALEDDRGNYGLLCEIARIPDQIRGFGPVKDANREAAHAKRRLLMARLDTDGNAPAGSPTSGKDGEAHTRAPVLEAAE